MLFDSHAHYDDKKFDSDRNKIIEYVLASGVSRILNAASDLETSRKSIELSEKYGSIYASVGVHPHNTANMDENTLNEIKKMARNRKVVAIGEIGLDYYYDNSPRDLQKYWFARQIDLAVTLGLPVIIHDRDAHKDTMDIVAAQNARDVGGVFHCYSGSVEMLHKVIDNNFYISIGGAVTFKNAKRLVDVVKYVPEDRLLIETDCPYMAPEPFRGQRNDSSKIRLVAEKIAEIKGKSFETIAWITYVNSCTLFNVS